MDARAMMPHGLALLAHFNGEHEAQLTVRRDDGVESVLPVSHFFRSPDDFSSIELTALELCKGHVLDIGAGTGLHSLAMQAQGMTVTAIDISPEAVEIMSKMGVQDLHCDDVCQFRGGPFDTLLMLDHGIGMVEDLPGLGRFLAHAHQLARSGGQILLHSLDVRQTDDPSHLAHHAANRLAGRYVGETRVQFEYEGRSGPYCGWLHVDPQVLMREAESAGWECEVVAEAEGGDYLARLIEVVNEVRGR
jgi:2-polyprenyl-3-methyl-5-hydroxy-6-metoxy-1,4-benzoquinol methylase